VGYRSRGHISPCITALAKPFKQKSRHFFRITNDGHGYRLSLWQALEILDQSRKLATNVGLNDLLATLRANAGGNRLDNDQLPLKPKVLIDSLLFHLPPQT